MSRTALRSLIRNRLSIPTIPETIRRINALIEDPDVGIAEIGTLVAQDAPLAAKVLRIANSAYYGLAGECVSTEHATTVLGLKVLKNIVTQAAVIDQFEHITQEEGFDVAELWRHSIRVGRVCKELATHARKVTRPTPDELYVCGLVHDIGKVVMLDSLGGRYARVLHAAERNGHPLHLVERREFEFSHTDVGATVAGRWDLPAEVCAAIQHHHGPREEVQASPVVSLVANANLLVHRLEQGDVEAARSVFDAATDAQLGVSADHVERVIAFALEIWDEQE